MQKINYLPYLDGLRCISIILVLFYHAEIPFFSGGFIGVDIFFVISGYLISQIFYKNFEKENFMKLFFESRIRKLLPGILLICIFSLPLSWFILFPDEIINFSNSLIGSSLFFSNFIFYLQSNYFDKISINIPLLHTWSLAIEIQFYIIFSLLFFLTLRFGNRLKFTLLLSLIFILFILSYYFSTHYLRLENFYFPLPRFWEFLIGVLIFVFQINKKASSNSKKNEILSILGIFLIFLSLIFIDQNSRYPGIITILPVTGVFLIITFSNHTNLLGKLLSYKPLTYIGKISYSLYLWHYPIISFYSLYFFKISSIYEKIFLITISILVSSISYKYFELPLRDKNKYPFKKFLRINIFLFLIIFIFSSLNKYYDGFNSRFSFQVQKNINVLNEKNTYPKNDCADRKLGENCVLNTIHSEQIALWGDSVANLAVDQIVNAANTNNKSTIIYTYLGCPPFDYFEHIDGRCAKRNKEILEELVNNKNLSFIIFFGDYLQGIYDNSVVENRSNAINKTILKLLDSGKKVIFLYPIPKFKNDIPKIKVKEQYRNINNSYYVKFNEYKEKNKILINKIVEINHRNFYPIPLSDIFCSQETNKCFLDINGNLLYIDGNHPSSFAINIIVNKLSNLLIK